MIHPSAIVAPSAKIAAGTAVGPFAIVEDDVVIGENCRIAAHAIIKSGTILETGVHVDHHAVIGGLPQDLGFNPETKTGVRVKTGTRIREGVTIHRATKEGGFTVIGENCFLMALAHVAHDCALGDNVILANAATLGGHVQVGERAFISGGAVVHQFVRIGESVMVSGNSRTGMDVPPYCIALERNCVAGLNLIGLRRRGFLREAIANIKNCYRAVYRDDSLNLSKNAAEALAGGLATTPEGRAFLEFFSDADSSKRHQFVRPRTGDGSGEE